MTIHPLCQLDLCSGMHNAVVKLQYFVEMSDKEYYNTSYIHENQRVNGRTCIREGRHSEHESHSEDRIIDDRTSDGAA